MSDEALVERLRLGVATYDDMADAADRIEAQDAEITRLRAALNEATALQKRVAELEAQNDTLRHATDKLRAMLTELNARHEPLQRAFITAVELLNDAALTGGKDE